MSARRLALAAALACAALPAAPALGAGPPQIGTLSASNLSATSALLSAGVNPEGLAASAHFEYADDAGFQAAGFAGAATTPAAQLGSGEQQKTATAALEGLTPKTTYHYRIIATNSAGSALGEGTFKTTEGFGFLPGAEGFDVNAINDDGSIDTQAGSHPYAISTQIGFRLAGELAGQPGVPFTDGDLKDLQIELPPGLIENPNAAAKCSQALFATPRSSPFEASLSGESCPDRSQIGVIALHSSFGGATTRYFGLFNLTPPPGRPAQLGTSPYGVPIIFTPRLRGAEGSYGLTLDSPGISQVLDLYGAKLTIWGTPWGVGHSGERGNCLNEAEPAFPWAKCGAGSPKNFPRHAYLTLPTSCAGPLSYTASADSWQQSNPALATAQSHDREGSPLDLGGCDRLAVRTAGSVTPTTALAASPSGLDFDLDVDEEGFTNPAALAPSQIEKATVALPEGMTINPSVGAGLGVCTPAQYAAESAQTPPGAGCPNDAKIGDVTLHSPLFEETVGGSLFLAEPDDPASTTSGAENPFDTLLALYIIAKSTQRGLIVKVAGKVDADPASGRLVALFEGLPQLPYTNFSVHFREGQRAVMISPPACGTYTTAIALAPWLDPNAQIHNSSQFKINSGEGGGPCPTGAIPPFEPRAVAGTLNPNAGSYTPFYLHLTRTDAEQEITSYSTELAPGLLGKIAGIPYCPEAAIEAAKGQSGTESKEHPPCPAASEIGHTTTGYGIGSVLAYAPGKLFLAGPYHGAPLSIVAIDSALVGPFDLGTVVVRSAIKVDRKSAQISIDSAGSDPIPHILSGIPLHLRDIRAYIDRPNLTVNPTSCDPFQITSTLSGAGTDFTSSADDALAQSPDPFQVSFCSSLGFKPRLSFKLKGGTKRGNYPALTATYRPRAGDANTASAAVTLPPSEFLDQSRIRTICTRPQSQAEACPAASIYGHAKAITPLLSEPLEGPVYLRSSSNQLPDLVVALHGAGITIDLQARIDSSHGGIRASFEGLPDAPVSEFTLRMNGGKRAILVNSANLCAAAQVATARLAGQNNRGWVLKPRLVAQCHRHHRAGRRG